jgi:pyridoxine 5-phosphate synthase
MKPRLGVNIDHVATLRQARGENYPSVVDAANTSFINGADQMTIHLREDRRHIQDTDVEAIQLVAKKYGRPLNFEMGCNQEIIDIAVATGPEWICLVPENRAEKTTEGGLNLKDEAIASHVQKTCEHLKANIKNVKISLFLEADPIILTRACEMPIDAVEIHTGDYASAHLNGESFDEHLNAFQMAKELLNAKSVGCHAGHGLTNESVLPLLKDRLFTEYNIGHWVICQAVFQGLGNVVADLNKLFEQYPVEK